MEPITDSYSDYVQDIVASRIRFGTLLASGIFLPALYLLLFLISPSAEEQKFIIFLAILTYIVAGAAYLVQRTLWFKSHGSYYIFIYAIVIPVGLHYVATSLGISHTTHWQIILHSIFLLVVIVVVPLTFRDAIFTCLLFMIVNSLLLLDEPEVFLSRRHLISTAILSLYVFIGLAGSYMLNQLREEEFTAKYELAMERIKSEKLIANMMPPTIAARLKEDVRVADKYGEATVLFTDLVWFTQLSSSMLPSKVVQIIDDIFTRFDAVVEMHGLEKIKTVGDAYMAVAGIPVETDNHAEAAATAALDMRQALQQFNKEMHETLDIRIGLHSGPLIAGVIGTKKMSYDVWGDTVNTASRMESHSENGKIQISETTYHFIKTTFQTAYRGEIEVKGKGLMKTYYLLGENE